MTPRLALPRFRETEIENFRPVRRQEQVRGFDIAVGNTSRVRRRGLSRTARAISKNDFRSIGPRLSRCEASHLEQFHRDEGRVSADIVDRIDIGMIER